VTAPDTGDNTIDNVEITISKSYHIPVRWNGEETKGLMNAGTYGDINQQRFVQAFRRLSNLIETDLASSYKYASRGNGTGNGPVQYGWHDLSDFANTMRILDDNGCPPDGLKFVLGEPRWQNLRGKQSNFYKVNEAGYGRNASRRSHGPRMGFESLPVRPDVAAHTKGTTTDATLTSADYAVGSTALTLASAGTGTIVEGDQVNIAGENNGIYYGVALATLTYRTAEL
jgi:hypothetical protein